ncbi:hypothetical protein P3T35_005502 [Kitasatospora sp. GP30]|jgi:hypothetical protein|uniref:hypothetical protein n=1 Tax=Kitasatospora sp. GP30 TaxID=3035084 RepID=UPI000C71431A|nr:hypothetical protein [Kitasatospora sp. GP30]MDH6143467.1 hypothetical protein [Kitasatospora sp. GP30]
MAVLLIGLGFFMAVLLLAALRPALRPEAGPAGLLQAVGGVLLVAAVGVWVYLRLGDLAPLGDVGRPTELYQAGLGSGLGLAVVVAAWWRREQQGEPGE